MNINMNTGINNTLLAVHRINHSIQKENVLVNPNDKENQRRDQVSISPLGKAQSMIELLTKQKQSIMENRQDLIGRTIENGGTMESIQDQLDAYDEQMKTIDSQIAQTQADQIEMKDSDSKETVQPKTQEEADAKQQKMVMEASMDVSRAETAYSDKQKMDGRVSVLESEQTLDRSRGSQGSLKGENIAELKSQSSQLMGKIGEQISDINKEMKNLRQSASEQPDENSNVLKSESYQSSSFIKEMQEETKDEDDK